MSTSYTEQFTKPIGHYEVEAIVNAKKKGSAKEVTIIDLRDPDEREDEGFIPYSYNLPAPDLADMYRLSRSNFKKKHHFDCPDKASPILLYCSNQRRSDTAAQVLTRRGFRHAVSYAGGHNDWQQKKQSNQYDDDL